MIQEWEAAGGGMRHAIGSCHRTSWAAQMLLARTAQAPTPKSQAASRNSASRQFPATSSHLPASTSPETA